MRRQSCTFIYMGPNCNLLPQNPFFTQKVFQVQILTFACVQALELFKHRQSKWQHEWTVGIAMWRLWPTADIMNEQNARVHPETILGLWFSADSEKSAFFWRYIYISIFPTVGLAPTVAITEVLVKTGCRHFYHHDTYPCWELVGLS